MWERLKNLFFGTSEQRAEMCYEMGMRDLDRGQLHYAEYHLKTALKLAPTSRKYLIALGNVLLLKGEIGASILEFERAVTTGERSFLALSNLGVALRLAGRLDEAVAAHEEAVSLGPKDPDTLLNAATTFEQHRGPNEGLPLLRRVLEIDPENAQAHYRIATVEGPELGEEEFLRHLDVAATMGSQRAMALLMKGAHYVATGRAAQGEDFVAEALSIDPDDCSVIESDERFESIRGMRAYLNFISNKPCSMYSCMTEAESVSEGSDSEQGTKKHLVVLSFARHTAEAREKARSTLELAGWSKFNLATMVPAHKESLKGFGPAAKAGWVSAERDGAHIFVF